MAEAPAAMVERALAASRTQGCVAIVSDTVHANLRWASSSLTTDGVAREVSMTVVALRGEHPDVSAGSITRTVRDAADVRRLVSDAEALAEQCGPEESGQPLVQGPVSPDFAESPATGGVAVLAPVTQPLGEALARARSDGLLLYGYAEHSLTTSYLGTSAGTRVRHVQPAGHLTMTAKSADLAASTWVGRASRDFTDVDVPALDHELRRRLAWSHRAAPLEPGRHEVLLPPSAVADLMIYAYWTMAGLDAHEGRSVYARPGHGTRVGQSLVDERVTLASDPHLPGLACDEVLVTSASSPMASVFDNGLPVARTAWVDRGTLAALVQTRHSARLTGLPVTPYVGNLHLDVDGGTGDIDDLVARTDDGVLLTSLWYLREVDPMTLLLTGLTRDGVHVVRGGEVIGTARNFRFNESPVDLLRRVRDAGTSMPTFSREWGEYFDRTSMPALRVADFHLSTVSDAL
jgi:predicted Zn-dependent protease